ncbi:hypothetical protein ULF88_11355 [Halopseudomonas pachastrellae]|nr:hypothetical protein [Halopseudomonas pachastrellae]
MIPVDGAFILAVSPRFSGARDDAQRRIVGDISAAFALPLPITGSTAACGLHTLWHR